MEPNTELVRQFVGYLIELDEEMAKVCFVLPGKEPDDFPGRHSGELPSKRMYFYELPAKVLRDAGVTARNQPFQLDEIRGAAGLRYEMKALATLEQAFIEKFELSPERKAKLAEIVMEFTEPPRRVR